MCNELLNKIAFAAIFMLLPFYASAQNASITATVKLQDGQFAEGAVVLVTGTGRGTAVNSKGVFTIAAKPSDSLLIAYPGFKKITWRAGAIPAVVYLQPDVSELNEVVITGYETKQKRDLTTAVVKVDTKNNTEGGYASFQQLIGGRAAGVQVMENNTDPGSGISVEIRGVSSISSSSQPLYVVDGIPLNNPNLDLSAGASNLASSSTSNPLTMINPNDIEAMDILKDAAATAIYGARGANGVVLITTKSGKAGKVKVSANANYAISKPSGKIEMLNARDFATYMNEGWAYRKAIGYNTTALQPYLPAEIDSLTTYDHQGAVQRTAPTKDAYISISGGDQRNKFFFSGQYFRQDGIIPATYLNRYNGKLTYEGKLRPDLTFTVSANLSNSLRSGQPTAVLSNKVLSWPSSVPMVNRDGTLNYLGLYQYGTGQASDVDVTRGLKIYYNPRFRFSDVYHMAYTNHPLEFGASHGVKNVQTSTQLLTNIGLEWAVDKYLKVSAKLGVTQFNALLENYTPSYYSQLKGAASAGNSQNNSVLYQLQANYNRKLGKSHNLSAFVVGSAEKFVAKSQTGSTLGFTSDVTSYYSLQSGTSPNTPYTTYSANQLVSSILSVSYNFKYKYYLSASGRMDGTSKFTEKERYGFFPAASVAWRVNQEKWFSPLNKVVSDLKLRASWGIVGNQSIAPYSTISSLNVASVVFGNTLNVGFAPANLPNPTLRWERTASVNFGMDLSLFNNRLAITAEAYRKSTNDLLYATTPPLTSGYNTLTRNIGKITNEGLEFSAGWKIVDGQKLRWSVDGNIAFNRNRVDQLAGGKDDYLDISQVVTGSYLFRLKPGQPIAQFYGLKSIGVWTDKTILEKPTDFQLGAKEGDRRYADLNKDGVLDDKDRTYYGSALPKFFGGFSSTLAYGGIELSTFFSYSVGNKIFNYYEFNVQPLNRGQSNIRKAVFDKRYRMVTPEMSAEEAEAVRRNNAVATVPVSGSIYDMRESTDYYLEDGTYLRCRDVTLSWELPMQWTKRMKLAGVKLYANCQNLFMLTSYSGYSPEINTRGGLARGVDDGTSPLGRVYRIGANVNF